MSRMNVLRRVAIVLAVISGVGLLSRPAAADSLSVESAHPDTAAGLLVIDGSGFRPGLHVSVNDVELKVLSVNAHEIRVALPPLTYGSYRMTVRQETDRDRGRDRDDRGDLAQFIVAIGGGSGYAGAQGSQGLQGPAGLAGATGLTGPAGPVGPAGPTGSVGATGLTGPVGAVGAAGPTGPAGTTGPAGPAGPVGATGPAGPAGATGAAGPVGPVGATGSAGPAGPQGLQGQQGLPGVDGATGSGALSVVAANGQTLGTVVGVTKVNGNDPAVVARKDNGVWLALLVDSETIQTGGFPILYLTPTCDGQAYAMVENSPVPLFRALQRVSTSDPMAFYAGDPVQVQSFQGFSLTRDPVVCQPAAGSGWDAPTLAGLLKTINMSDFPAPYTVQ